ncbi:hypothetical protein CHU00_06680 [Sphingobacterium cellulitidis]|nr:hypothetical protein CHU00_06680 [Sphingobacterium cellulitidis]
MVLAGTDPEAVAFGIESDVLSHAVLDEGFGGFVIDGLPLLGLVFALSLFALADTVVACTAVDVVGVHIGGYDGQRVVGRTVPAGGTVYIRAGNECFCSVAFAGCRDDGQHCD